MGLLLCLPDGGHTKGGMALAGVSTYKKGRLLLKAGGLALNPKPPRNPDLAAVFSGRLAVVVAPVKLEFFRRGHYVKLVDQ